MPDAERGRRGRAAPIGGVLACVLVALSPRAIAADWLPVSPDEIAMTSEPAAPNVPAIYLYRQVDRNDALGSEFDYRRIKILTEEGRKYADVQIVFPRATESIRAVQARVIHPDGRIVNFDGTVYEQTFLKSRGLKVVAKTFTLPDVQVGSIIEYSYRRALPEFLIYDSHWVLSEELFTKHAKFSLVKNLHLSLKWSWPLGLPDGTGQPISEHGVIRLEARDIPPFVTEESMPPENALKMRVDFEYSSERSPDLSPEQFWKRAGQSAFRSVEKFVDQRRAMERAVAQTVDPADAPATRLRKLYDRVQRMRNLSFERQRTEEEQKREKLRTNHDVDDVWTNGYGDGVQLAWLFLALARSAGIEADPVLVSSRDQHFFQSAMMRDSDLNTNVVRVRLDGQELFLDPGTRFAPFGLLPWPETGVRGLCLDKNGGSWVTTPTPAATESRVEHKAVLQLTGRGTLEGKLTVTYAGLEALARRLAQRNEDEQSRKQYLESEIKSVVPTGAEVALVNSPDWSSSTPMLVAEFDFTAPGWVTTVGNRGLLPVGLFGGGERHAFEHATRIHPLYVAYPNEQDDDIEITLPPPLRATNLPKPYDVDLTAVAYKSRAEDSGGKLHLRRQLIVRYVYLPPKSYGPIHAFYQQVRAGDEEQLVLSPAGPGAAR